MAERFPLERIPSAVHEIARRLIGAGHETWYVGGAVRDVLLERIRRRPPVGLEDSIIDIATSAKPEEVQKLFRRTVPIGIEHGTVAVLDDENRPHEVTTFRKDVTTDGRHAEVAFGVSLEDDLARRDFTINAVAVHPVSGETRDPFDGALDLEAGVVRAVGDPATRFREDYLRVLRALRFACTLDFTIEPATWAAVKAASKDLGNLSRERVRDEWLKTLGASAPSTALGMWRDAGVLVEVWPELAALPANLAMEGLPGDAVLVTAAALVAAGTSVQAAQAATKRMRFSNHDIDRVKGVIAALAGQLPDPNDAVAVRRWMSRNRAVAGDAAAVAGGALRKVTASALDSKIPLSIGDLAVTGEDLKQAGISAGPKMGEVLRALLESVLVEPALNSREALLAKAKGLA
ncbi:MAG: CCA tRNA nucleotidyltransferase [Gemmatimonadales bacterium]